MCWSRELLRRSRRSRAECASTRKDDLELDGGQGDDGVGGVPSASDTLLVLALMPESDCWLLFGVDVAVAVPLEALGADFCCGAWSMSGVLAEQALWAAET